MFKSYKGTIFASFTGYIIQAIINNFAPLLFLTFQSEFGIPLADITALITINFILQLCVDLASAFFIDKIGYRAATIIAHSFCAAGLVSYAILPSLLKSAYIGLLISIVLCALGGGLLEVIISPLVEACPSKNKSKTMSMLHSFYCWGSVLVVGGSTLFFALFGIKNWKILALIWAIVPILNGILFTRVPIYTLQTVGEKGMTVGALLKKGMFWLLFVVILCAGASEQAVSQWASAFTESALGIPKSFGDLLGPALFAVTMGISRVLYGKFGEKVDLSKMMLYSAILTVISYLVVSLVNIPALSLAGLAVSGFAVGILWPGTYSKAAGSIKGGGTAMFALLALGGDVGCSLGPTLAGLVSGAFADDLKIGILSATVFPVLLTVAMTILVILGVKKKKKGNLIDQLPDGEDNSTPLNEATDNKIDE